MSENPKNLPQGAYPNYGYTQAQPYPIPGPVYAYPAQYVGNNPHDTHTQPAEEGPRSPLRDLNARSQPQPRRTLREMTSFSDPNMITRKNDRRHFIAKVYGILACQLAFTTVVLGVVLGNEETRDRIKELFWVFIACWIGTIVLMVGIVCSKKLSRKFPINYICLFLFTLLETFILAYFCAYYNPVAVFTAGLLTFVVTLALSIYALKTKTDFTSKIGIFIVAFVSLSMFGILMIFFWSVWLYVLYGCIAVIIFSIFIIYDTQLIAGGRYGELTYDDYVIGSLLLYIDIIGLFMYLLSLLGISSGR
jgi:FtsH-binding integral membrane protein